MITNNTGGTFDNYIFRLSGTGPIYGGSFRSAKVTGCIRSRAASHDRDDHHHPEPASGRTLPHPIGPVGVLGALEILLNSQANTVNGSGRGDHLLAFGTGDTLTAGSGHDLLWHVAGARHIMIGGTGNDTFRLDWTTRSRANPR